LQLELNPKIIQFLRTYLLYIISESFASFFI